MPMEQQNGRVVRFGVFEADLLARELRKRGVRVRLQEQPFRLLQALLERPGQIVTREEIKDKLWPDDTFVDFDKSLNTAAQKLRQALGDSAESPRFLETIPRQGYRFLAQVASSAESSEPSADEHDVLPQAPAQSLRVWRVATFALAALVVVLAGLQFWRDGQSQQDRQVRKLMVRGPGPQLDPVISPDGRRIVFRRGSFGSYQGWVQELDREGPRPLGVSLRLPFWSPDSQNIGFYDAGLLKVIPAEGGETVTLCPVPRRNFWGGTWSPDGSSIVFASGRPSSLYEVSAGGGSPSVLLAPDASKGETSLEYPRYLPTDRQVLLFELWAGDELKAVAWDRESDERVEIAYEGRNPTYSRTDHVLYRTDDGLWAAPFSQDAMEAGEPFVVVSESNVGVPSISDDGVLAYRTTTPGVQQLAWFDRQGELIENIGQPQDQIAQPRLSPSGDRVAAIGVVAGEESIWIHDLERQVATRLTKDAGREQRPVWSEDGRTLYYSVLRNGQYDIHRTLADGSGSPVAVTEGAPDEYPFDLTPGGERLIYDTLVAAADVWHLRLSQTGKGSDVQPFLATGLDEGDPRLSPDGAYLAYQSQESGEPQVYLREFPAGGGRVRVSPDSGNQPIWRRDGKELFYARGGTIMAVSVERTSTLSVGRPRALFEGEPSVAGRGHRYDVSADGQRFVMPRTLQEPVQGIRVVENWYEEFRDREE